VYVQLLWLCVYVCVCIFSYFEEKNNKKMITMLLKSLLILGFVVAIVTAQSTEWMQNR